MKTLIVEDDFTSRLLLQKILSKFGPSHIAINGREAVQAVGQALQEKKPYDLICMDIMMPEMDGQEALQIIRKHEESMGILSTHGSKIIMVTALDDPKNVIHAFHELCDAYICKPVVKSQLLQNLRNLNLIK